MTKKTQDGGSLSRWSGHKIFRSVEDWQSALMTLPDNNFFELLRSVFGNIKTPFNKQRLLGDLFNLLSRNEIRKIIAAYIDETDHKVICAVALLNEPTPQDMGTFLAGEFSGTALHAALINLEERLIVYRFRDEGIPRLALNPVLEQVLLPFIADASVLFPGFVLENTTGSRKAESSPPACIHDGRVLAAFFAFIFTEEELYKAEGLIRKKVLEEGEKIFPFLDLELCTRALLLMGLLESEGRSLAPCFEKIEEFSGLSPLERLEYWTAGVYLCLKESDREKNAAGNSNSPQDMLSGTEKQSGAVGLAGNNPTEKNSSGEVSRPYILTRYRLRSLALFIHGFRNFLDTHRTYPEISLRRFAGLLEREEVDFRDFRGFENNVELSFELFLSAMEKTGLLEREGSSDKNNSQLKADCWKAGPALLSSEKDRSGKETEKPVVAMDTAFSIILYPEISFQDALMLGSFCSVKENTKVEPLLHRKSPGKSGVTAGSAVYFELTRQSAMRGFDQGISAEAMTKHIEKLAHNRIDSNLGWTLKDWEGRYAGVSLHHGLVLALAEDRRYLAEAAPVASLIQRNLAPGVYLLSSEEKTEAVRALKKAGVDIVAQPPARPAAKTRGMGSLVHSRNTFQFFHASGIPGSLSSFHFNKKEAKGFQEPSDGSEAIRENFYRALNEMKLTKQERDELTARIDRRLVLSESQLEKTSLRYEKLEAKGLDYPGKLAIAKQAADSGSVVEISWPGSDGEINRAAGIVQALEKKEGENIVILKSFSTEEGETEMPVNATLRIPLGKISLLRRIKKSIFGE